MIDEMYDRAYQHGRAALNRDLAAASDKVASKFGETLRTLNRIQWSAPWKKSEKST